jgi:nitroreductase
MRGREEESHAGTAAQEKKHQKVQGRGYRPRCRGASQGGGPPVANLQKLQALEVCLRRRSRKARSAVEGEAVGVVVCADEKESDVWTEDCSIASIILQLAGQSLGLGSCWIQIRLRMHDGSQTSEEYVRSVLGLPDGLKVESIIAFGYPDEDRGPVPAEELQQEKILSALGPR